MQKLNTVRELIDLAAQTYADKPAYVEQVNGEMKTVSFRQVKEDVDALETALNARGWKGRHIGVMGVNSYGWVRAYLAALCGLGVVVPIPADTPAEGLKTLVRTADVSVILADDLFAPSLKPLIETVSFSECEALIEDGKKRIAAGDSTVRELAPAGDDFSKIIFTSGTTGERRGVMLSQRNMMCIATSEFIPLAGNVSISILPMSHAFESVCHVLVMLSTGGLLYLCPSLRLFPPMVATSGADSLYIVPALAEALLTRFRPFLDKATKLRRLICGGAPVPQALVDAYDKLGIQVMTGYGLSECAPLVSLNTRMKKDAIGMPGSYCEVRIADDGEIQVRGENVMKSYYKNEAATRAAFTEDGWFKTGDLGRLDEDGCLYLTGRIKNLIILGNGENVSPEELETLAVNQIPGVRDALVTEENQTLAIALFVEGDTGEEALANARASIAELNKTLPAYKRLMSVRLTAEPFATNATGKKIR